MNVKTGDIAMIVGSKYNSGAIGTVGKFIGTKKFHQCSTIAYNLWEMHFDRPLKVELLQDNSIFFTQDPLVKDAVLRKITGPDITMDEIEKIEVEHV